VIYRPRTHHNRMSAYFRCAKHARPSTRFCLVDSTLRFVRLLLHLARVFIHYLTSYNTCFRLLFKGPEDKRNDVSSKRAHTNTNKHWVERVGTIIYLALNPDNQIERTIMFSSRLGMMDKYRRKHYGSTGNLTINQLFTDHRCL